jgi:hypothetical protein
MNVCYQRKISLKESSTDFGRKEEKKQTYPRKLKLSPFIVCCIFISAPTSTVGLCVEPRPCIINEQCVIFATSLAYLPISSWFVLLTSINGKQRERITEQVLRLEHSES